MDQNDDQQDAGFRHVMQEYGQMLRHHVDRLCPRRLGIQPEDIEQEVRLRLWRAVQSERKIENLASYLYRIAATATIDAMRRVRVRREELTLPADEPAEGDSFRPAPLVATDPSPERTAEQQQLFTAVQAGLALLPDNRRQAVGLHLQGFTTEEIGGLLGWTEPKARNLVHRGLKTLRQTLQERGIQHEAD